jgi:L-fuconolactonase
MVFANSSTLFGDCLLVRGTENSEKGLTMKLSRHLFFGIILVALITQPGIAADKKTNVDFPKVKHIIDTHIHIYDTRRPKGVPWPPKDDKVLYKPHLPAEFKKVSQACGVTGVVIVEASDRLEDNLWVLDLVSGDDFFTALVGNIDPYRKDFEVQLKKLKKDKRFVGVRARNPKPIDYTDPRVLKNFRTLAKHNLSLDFLANGQGLKAVKDVDRLARAVPNLRIVVDHVIGKNIDGKRPDPEWVKAVVCLASNPNVYCKVSGLYQRAKKQPAPKNEAYYRGVLDVMWKNFGKKRLIYGSNWPCTKRSGDYASFVRLVNSYFAGKGQSACEHYFWKNAVAAYRLKLK